MMQIVFTCLITLQFLIIVIHDWIDIPGWLSGSRVQATVGRRKLMIASIINAVFPGLAVGFALWFWNRPKPTTVTSYWTIYCAVTLTSAIGMWYVPYFFGTSEKTKRMYNQMYEGTLQVLPARGDNPRPNLMHLCFHVLFVATFCLALVICFGR